MLKLAIVLCAVHFASVDSVDDYHSWPWEQIIDDIDSEGTDIWGVDFPKVKADWSKRRESGVKSIEKMFLKYTVVISDGEDISSSSDSSAYETLNISLTSYDQAITRARATWADIVKPLAM